MNFRNESPYHTATLRRITVATFRGLLKPLPAQVRVVEGRVNLRIVYENGGLGIFLPKLTGAEFVVLLRQQHGGAPARYNPAIPAARSDLAKAGIHTATFAQALQRTVAAHDYKDLNWYGTMLHPEIERELKKAKVPIYVPLRVIKPKKGPVPRDIVQERYKRVCELEARWQRKLKLAQTKLKKIRSKKKHYHKKLNIQPEE